MSNYLGCDTRSRIEGRKDRQDLHVRISTPYFKKNSK
jgi:hypothetical protein